MEMESVVINSINTLEEYERIKKLLKKRKREIYLKQSVSLTSKLKKCDVPNSFDKKLFNVLGGNKILIERNIGRYWGVVFDENNILQELKSGNNIFRRTISYTELNDNFYDIPHCLFWSVNNENGKIETISITYVPNSSSNNIVMSGIRCCNHIHAKDTGYDDTITFLDKN